MSKYFNEKMECMSRAEMTRLQSERLVKLVKYVYDNVKTYRDKMDAINLKPEDIKGIEDITKLPFTTKQDLRDGYPFGMFATDTKNIVRVHASSGTTGKLTVVGYTQNDIDNWSEACARCLVSAGATQDSVVHVAYGYGLFTGGLGAHYGSEKLGSMTVPISGGGTQKQLMLIEDFGADILCCTPSYAQYLAEEMDKVEGYRDRIKLKAGVFGAEPWTEEMRDDIEKRMNIKAYNIYGLSEITGPGVSMECERQNGAHIQEDLFYPEIIHPDTLERLGGNEDGELVFTTLLKEGIPLIRYRTRDICSLNYDVCECGRTSVRMSRIFGRTDDMLIIRGVNVFPSQIESVLLNIGGGLLPHYQIVVDRVNSLDTIEVKVEVTDELFSDEVKVMEKLVKKIEADMYSMLSLKPKITLCAHNSLPRNIGLGKVVRVIDNRKLV